MCDHNRVYFIPNVISGKKKAMKLKSRYLGNSIVGEVDVSLLRVYRLNRRFESLQNGLLLEFCHIRKTLEACSLAIQVGRYAHARQYNRMQGSLRKLKSRVGRIHRELIRQFELLPPEAQQSGFELLQKVERILTQQPKDKNKLYSLHAPEVECISKGKARNPDEFGVKVSIATTLKEGLIVGMRSMPGNPDDGHTLYEALEQASILADHRPKMAIVDKGYKGAAIDGIQIWRSGQRAQSKTLKKMMKRRSSIEPAIGHMKMDGRLARNPLKGAIGDALFAVLCGAGHNLRLILRKLRLFYSPFLAAVLRNILATLKQKQLTHHMAF
jgi:IS5 family transposase